MRYLLNRLRHWAGGLLFDIKYKLGIAKEDIDFVTCNKNDQPSNSEPKEFRCTICESRFECPAYNTGVIFPCAYFKEESYV